MTRGPKKELKLDDKEKKTRKRLAGYWLSVS